MMTPEQFCYWLQGRSELVQGQPTPEEWAAIREHLNLVFKKVTSETISVPRPKISELIC